MYNVVEKFVSINGESKFAGQLAVFIRFRGCNLNCVYCDTKWANTADAPAEQMTKEEVLNFIRKRLSFGPEIKRQLKHVDEDDFSKEHRRFEMSGYEQTTGWCTLFNTAILNEFANLGIYDYTSYLFLDFDKGTPTVYLKYYDENENLEYDLNGYTTTEIIFTIFELTIFSGRPKRPRS